MNEGSSIQSFFDEMSVNRDDAIAVDPLIQFEQEMRQQGVLALLEAQDESSVLDVGCGNARDIRSIIHLTKGIVVGVDLSPGMVRAGKVFVEREFSDLACRVKLLVADGRELPFVRGYFDSVVCSEVIEHVPEYSRLVEEIHRVLRPGGRLVITTPNMHSMYGVQRVLLDYAHAIFRGGPHRRAAHPYDAWKTRSEVVSTLRQIGFRVERQVGLCYLPGELAYALPYRWKERILRLSAVLERLFRRTGVGGYMMGILAIKDVKE